MVILGDPDIFAIEYDLDPGPPLWGPVRIWVQARWLGDLADTSCLAIVAECMNGMRGRRRRFPLLFEDDGSVRTFEHLRAGSHWSFGPAFDDFDFIYYAVASTQRVHWIWEPRAELALRYDHYPTGRFHGEVPFAVYDAVLGEFLQRLGIPDDVAPGVRWRYDPRGNHR